MVPAMNLQQQNILFLLNKFQSRDVQTTEIIRPKTNLKTSEIQRKNDCTGKYDFFDEGHVCAIGHIFQHFQMIPCDV